MCENKKTKSSQLSTFSFAETNSKHNHVELYKVIYHLLSFTFFFCYFASLPSMEKPQGKSAKGKPICTHTHTLRVLKTLFTLFRYNEVSALYISVNTYKRRQANGNKILRVKV